MNFGERLKRLREAQGLSLRQLESASGVHFTTLARYEKMDPNARVSIQELCRLADALQVSLDELAGRVPPARPPRDSLEARLDRLEALLGEVPDRVAERLAAPASPPEDQLLARRRRRGYEVSEGDRARLEVRDGTEPGGSASEGAGDPVSPARGRRRRSPPDGEEAVGTPEPPG